jgi:predicted small metal-binding protein
LLDLARESRDEVLGKAAEHAADVHGMTVPPDEVVEQVKASIVATG